MRIRRLMPLVLGFYGCCQPLMAQTHPANSSRDAAPSIELPAPPSGLSALNAQGKVVSQCPLQRTEVQSDIAGTIARVQVRQHFSNPSKEPIEALYTFPLPHEAAVDGMKFTIGPRIIKGEIKRREEARQIYDAAKNAGQSAALLDQERPNIFTQRVANLMPGAEVVVEISFVQPIPYRAGQYEWVFPTVVGPRYTPTGGYQQPGERGLPAGTNPAPNTNAVVEDPEKITPPITPQGQRAGHDLTLDIRLTSPVALGEVTSALHPIEVKKQGEAEARISLKDGAELPNRDLVLRWKPKQNEVQTGLVTHSSGQGGYFSLILQPPTTPPQQQISPKEMVFVIDQTGSQQGAPIAKAKETMRYCIQNLNPGDTFQILGFTTEVYPCFEKPVPVNKANIETALRYIEPLEGHGGTDILKATERVLSIPDDPARSRVVCFMTDGYVGNEAQIMKYVAEKSGRAKMFPFGVGNSVNRNLIDGMAREGRGVAEYVLLNEDGQTTAKRFYDRVSTPLLVNIGVTWGDLPVRDVLPGGIPDLYESGPIVLTGRYSKPASGDIIVTGMLGNKPWRQVVHLDFPKEAKGGEGLPSLWARQRITEIESQVFKGTASGEKPRDTRNEVTQLALEYHLMSQYTSFVAVEQKVVNEGGKQRTVDVPVEMADGVNYGGVFGDVILQHWNSNNNTQIAQGLLYSRVGASAGNFGGGSVMATPSPTRPPVLEAAPKERTPEQIKLDTRNAKAPESLLQLLALWPEGAENAAITPPEGVEIENGLVKIQISISPANPKAKEMLLEKLRGLGLVEIVEWNTRVLSGRLPVSKLDALFTLPEVDMVQPAK